MPIKREAHSDGNPSTAKKVKGEIKTKKEDEGSIPDDQCVINGPWTLEEERFVLLSALVQCQFKLTKDFRDEMAERLKRSPKAVNNFWYRQCAKQIKDLDIKCRQDDSA